MAGMSQHPCHLSKYSTQLTRKCVILQVCARLGLVSLAYMWHQPQAALLRGMIASGVEAVLIKVAALGLVPQRHLGRTLQEMEPHLHKMCRSVWAPVSCTKHHNVYSMLLHEHHSRGHC